MKVWRATYQDEDEGCCVLWAANQRELRALVREQTGTSNPELLHIERVEIGTTRAALVRWLNVHVTHYND